MMKFFESWLFNLSGHEDEAQKGDLFVISTKGLSLSIILDSIVLVISIVIDISNRNFTPQTFLVGGSLIFLSGYLLYALLKKHVLLYEAYSQEEFNNAVSNLKFKTSLQVLFAFIVFNLIFTLGSAYILHENASVIDVLISFVFCFLYGTFIYRVNKAKIKREF
ncbi:hypothetical protein [uncultured Rummeliibacillus sp.]|uniref:hypothetical protein n=1 Tax=uncultured Rummeliibacillus sp. TaxID=762292 RepID=UPI002634D1FE|nr:hypothetical protein [uncultured Rummeliibacillus sp.]